MHSQRKTHSAYKTVGILYALRQTRCGLLGAAAEVKIIKPHYVCSFIIFSFISYEWKALSTQR
ncbi:unnamed protein product [Bemisia tabaci]|uniref:Uncharacterized protein n=1 Tax=Bemisia tabaci TaxID=7038 RepID=A0A9P0EXF0_BEMTA|nr:unnamed protein product [Bemisia tabaci]